MRQLIITLLLIVSAFSLTIHEASARGFSGRGGFGMFRSKQMFTQSRQASKTPSAATRGLNHNRWRGTLTGLLLGSLITSLFMSHGLGSMLFSWFLVGMIIYFLRNFFRRRIQTGASN